MATTTAWLPKRAAQRLDQRRVGDGRGVERDLVGAGPQHVAHLLDRADPATDRERDERPARGPFHDVQERAASFRSRRDVEEDELVRPFARVAFCELRRVALVHEIDEAGALDDPAVGDVQTRDDAAAQHQAAAPAGAAVPARTSPTKFARSRSPSVPLRSGWNWTPSSRPRATADTNGRP